MGWWTWLLAILWFIAAVNADAGSVVKKTFYADGSKEFTIVKHIKKNECTCSCKCVPDNLVKAQSQDMASGPAKHTDQSSKESNINKVSQAQTIVKPESASTDGKFVAKQALSKITDEESQATLGHSMETTTVAVTANNLDDGSGLEDATSDASVSEPKSTLQFATTIAASTEENRNKESEQTSLFASYSIDSLGSEYLVQSSTAYSVESTSGTTAEKPNRTEATKSKTITTENTEESTTAINNTTNEGLETESISAVAANLGTTENYDVTADHTLSSTQENQEVTPASLATSSPHEEMDQDATIATFQEITAASETTNVTGTNDIASASEMHSTVAALLKEELSTTTPMAELDNAQNQMDNVVAVVTESTEGAHGTTDGASENSNTIGSERTGVEEASTTLEPSGSISPESSESEKMSQTITIGETSTAASGEETTVGTSTSMPKERANKSNVGTANVEVSPTTLESILIPQEITTTPEPHRKTIFELQKAGNSNIEGSYAFVTDAMEEEKKFATTESPKTADTEKELDNDQKTAEESRGTTSEPNVTELAQELSTAFEEATSSGSNTSEKVDASELEKSELFATEGKVYANASSEITELQSKKTVANNLGTKEKEDASSANGLKKAAKKLLDEERKNGTIEGEAQESREIVAEFDANDPTEKIRQGWRKALEELRRRLKAHLEKRKNASTNKKQIHTESPAGIITEENRDGDVEEQEGHRYVIQVVRSVVKERIGKGHSKGTTLAQATPTPAAVTASETNEKNLPFASTSVPETESTNEANISMESKQDENTETPRVTASEQSTTTEQNVEGLHTDSPNDSSAKVSDAESSSATTSASLARNDFSERAPETATTEKPVLDEQTSETITVTHHQETVAQTTTTGYENKPVDVSTTISISEGSSTVANAEPSSIVSTEADALTSTSLAAGVGSTAETKSTENLPTEGWKNAQTSVDKNTVFSNDSNVGTDEISTLLAKPESAATEKAPEVALIVDGEHETKKIADTEEPESSKNLEEKKHSSFIEQKNKIKEAEKVIASTPETAKLFGNEKTDKKIDHESAKISAEKERLEKARLLRAEQERIDRVHEVQKGAALKAELERQEQINRQLEELAKIERRQREMIERQKMAQKEKQRLQALKQVPQLDMSTSESSEHDLHSTQSLFVVEEDSRPTTAPALYKKTAVKTISSEQAKVHNSQCEVIRTFARIYEMKNPGEWVERNCVFAKQYFPKATCPQLKHLFDSCF